MRSSRGFTLLEILVALTLFAVVGGTLLQLFEGGLRSSRQAAEYSHAVLLARSKLTEVLQAQDLSPGTLEGDFTDGYRWTLLLSEPLQWNDDAESSWLKPLDLYLTISWGEPGSTKSFQLRSLYLSTSSNP